MGYGWIMANKENQFYPVTDDQIREAEKEIDLAFPEELVNFYKEVGYGFMQGSEYNINRLMDPYSVRDFRLRVDDYEFYPDIEIYDDYEDNKLIFFEGSESALMSIECNGKDRSPVYYYNSQIAESLEEFLRKIADDDHYYLGLLVDE
ncbi:SMI1/KNR4 family protein [Rossellomorea sp. FS2]|uniref:SMI1/KNR4 family protein n=1 Tax=Rossellomorea sp. FS2 TaxID=3391447 RepID=UPI003A4DF22B